MTRRRKAGRTHIDEPATQLRYSGWELQAIQQAEADNTDLYRPAPPRAGNWHGPLPSL